MATASYVYAVTRDVDPAALGDVRGLGDARLRAVPVAELAAVVGDVDLAEFGEEALRRNLERLDWLEGVARAHHRVVDAVAAARPVVPFRLATVYLDDERVRAGLAERRAELAAALARVEGRTEWGVKCVLVAEPAPDAADADPERPGTAFLRRRQAERAGRERGREAGFEQAERLHAALAARSVASRRYPPQPAQLSGERREMLLNAAYLVEGADPAALADVVRELGIGPLSCELSGPWAPYSFATLEDAP